MKRLLALYVASIVASGCGSGGPAAPTPPVSPGAGAFAVSGAVTDAEGGRPLVGAWVELEGGNENRSVSTGSEGLFSVSGLPSGPWTVRVSKFGYEAQSLYVDVTEDMTVSFELRRGRTEQP